MARPKKLSDTDAIQLVDSLYECCGNTSMLKFSELEKHAAALGISNVKAYDLRRNPVVLKRIAEIETLTLNEDSPEILAYKGLDIDAFVQLNRTPDKLKRSLSELDERWRKLYNYAVSVSEQNRRLTDKLRDIEKQTDMLLSEKAEFSKSQRDENTEARAIHAENTYLRKMLKKYLYPALADEVLRNAGEPNIGNANSSNINTATVNSMCDGIIPESFSESAAADSRMRFREDDLLIRLHNIAKGSSDDAT